VQRFFRLFRELLQELVRVDDAREEVVDRGVEDPHAFAREQIGVRHRLGAARAELVVELPVALVERGGRDHLAHLGPVGQEVQAVGLRLQGFGVGDRLVLMRRHEVLEVLLGHEQVHVLAIFHQEVGNAQAIQQCHLDLGVCPQHGCLLAVGTN